MVILAIITAWAIAGELGQEVPGLPGVFLAGMAVLGVVAVTIMWRDIARWDAGPVKKVLWMISSLSGVGFILWIIISDSEKRRRLERERQVTSNAPRSSG